MTQPDSIEARISATPSICEKVYASLQSRKEGCSVTNLSYFTGLSRVLVIDALEQMERRGATSHDGPRWFVVIAAS